MLSQQQPLGGLPESVSRVAADELSQRPRRLPAARVAQPAVPLPADHLQQARHRPPPRARREVARRRRLVHRDAQKRRAASPTSPVHASCCGPPGAEYIKRPRPRRRRKTNALQRDHLGGVTRQRLRRRPERSRSRMARAPAKGTLANAKTPPDEGASSSRPPSRSTKAPQSRRRSVISGSFERFFTPPSPPRRARLGRPRRGSPWTTRRGRR